MKRKTEYAATKGNTASVVALCTSVVAILLCSYTYLISKRSKIACIDTAKVLKAYKGIEELSKSFQEKNNLFKARLDTLAQDFQKSLVEFEKKRSHLTSVELESEKQKLKRRQEAYESYNAGNQENLKNEEMKLIQKAVVDVNNTVNQYAKNNGYSIVFGALPNSEVIYASEYIDITDEILEIVNN